MVSTSAPHRWSVGEGFPDQKTFQQSAGGSAAENGTSVDLTRIKLQEDSTAIATWNVVVGSSVEGQGFDVRVEATLSDGKAQTVSRSFCHHDRR